MYLAALARRGRLDSTDSMTQNRIESVTDQPTVPPILLSWLAVFRPCFTAPVWNHVLVLVGGAVLAPGKRTVTQALRVMGLADRPGFGRYHEALNRARWDARDIARRLLGHLLAVLWPDGEIVIAIDDTIERRWGGKIRARGIYRDAVRSSHGHFVKTSGLRWLSLAVMLPIPFAGQRWALPFLTVLAPSARWSEAQGRRHKALTDWAKQAILQTKRWLPDRRLVVVADSGFSALELIAAVRRYVCLITRLRLDASWFEPAPSCIAAAVQRKAIDASRQRLTLRQTRRIVPSMFSMMLVQASERRSGRGRPSRITVSISSMPSRMLAATPGATCSSRRVKLRMRRSALSTSSSSQAWRNAARTGACRCLGSRSRMLRALCTWQR